MMAFVVSSRTREIGTRMALGAAPDAFSGACWRRAFVWWCRHRRRGDLFVDAGANARGALAGLSPADPIAFGGAIAVLMFVGIAAIYFPARRAASLNPVEALRVD